MDLAAEKTAREARMRAKKEQIKAEMHVPAPEVTETHEKVTKEDTTKKATEENNQDAKPEKKPE